MNKCLLIVSAAPDLRELIHDTFGDEYEIHEADNGRFGLRMAEAIRPEVIFLDESLPGDLGSSALQACIKASAGLAGSRTVLLNTARHDWLRVPPLFSPTCGVMDIAGGLLHDAVGI